MATVYFARWVLLPDFTVVENGAVAVDGALVTAVGTRGAVRRGRSDRAVNLGQVLLMPGLINMHTHLEESAVRGLISPEDPFHARIAKKSTRLRHLDRTAVAQSVRLGAREMLTNGVTSVLDCSRLGVSADALDGEPIRAWVQCEANPDPAADDEDAVVDAQFGRSGSFPKGVGAAVGPYALFSLSPRTQRRMINHAREKGLLWASHIAESAEEVQAFSEREGDLYSMLTRRRPWPFAESAGPMHYAITSSMIPNGAICYHCNFATGNDLALLSVKQATLVICPRYTVEYHHRPFPVELAISRGIRICIGTESPAESEDLDLFEELFAMRGEILHVGAAEVLSWVTRNPAAALGMTGKLGVLAPGAFADIIGVSIAHDPRQDLLEELLTEEPTVRFVMVNGEEVVVDL